MGTSVSATSSEASRAKATVRASSWNTIPIMPCMKMRGKKTHSVVMRRCDDRHADLAAAHHRGLAAVRALLPVPEDVLQHHDGVVHQHADAERQAAQRHPVEADVDLVEKDERRHHGKWNGKGDNDRRAERCAGTSAG